MEPYAELHTHTHTHTHTQSVDAEGLLPYKLTCSRRVRLWLLLSWILFHSKTKETKSLLLDVNKFLYGQWNSICNQYTCPTILHTWPDPKSNTQRKKKGKIQNEDRSSRDSRVDAWNVSFLSKFIAKRFLTTFPLQHMSCWYLYRVTHELHKIIYQQRHWRSVPITSLNEWALRRCFATGKGNT
jgi:hypothetical protein